MYGNELSSLCSYLYYSTILHIFNRINEIFIDFCNNHHESERYPQNDSVSTSVDIFIVFCYNSIKTDDQ